MVIIWYEVKMATTRTIFQRFLNEHPDAKAKHLNFEDCYPEIECIIEWYEGKMRKIKEEWKLRKL